MTPPINSLLDYAQSLVRPLRVLVIDTDVDSFSKVANALAPYDAEVFYANCRCSAKDCLQKHSPFDLVCIGMPLTDTCPVTAILAEVVAKWPEASIVIMAKNPQDTAVVEIMERGPFMFLKKNGSFDHAHVQRIASQLNLKLRPSGKARVENEKPAVTTVDIV